MGTLAANDRRTAVAIAFAGQTQFPADFPVIDPDGILVDLTRAGVTTTLTSAVFTVSNATESGFDLNLLTPCEEGDQVVIYSRMTVRRNQAYPAAGAVRTEALENDFTRVVAMVQELRRDLGDGGGGGGGPGGPVAWADITGKPATFPPSPHSHAWGDITGKPATFAPSAHGHAWNDITGKPATFAPSAHGHPAAEISDLPEAVQDHVATMLQPGTGVVIDYDDASGELTISVTGGGGGGGVAVHPGDLLLTARTPEATYLLCNGAQYAIAAYPDLAPLMEKVTPPPPVLGAWTERNDPFTAYISCVATDGAGNWVAGGFGGALATSSDNGATWTLRNSGFGSSTIEAVAYGNGVWVIVGDDGKIATATDPHGAWTLRANPFGSGVITSVAYGNGIWVAVGQTSVAAGKVLTATNPTGTWTDRGDPGFGSSAPWGVTYGHGVWVAVGSGGKIFSASDPTGAWTQRGAGVTTAPLYAVTIGDGGRVVAAGYNGVLLTAPTHDGTYTIRSTPSTAQINTLRYQGGLYIAGREDGSILTSTDALAWTAATVAAFGGYGVREQAYGNGVWILVGAGDSSNTTIATATFTPSEATHFYVPSIPDQDGCKWYVASTEVEGGGGGGGGSVAWGDITGKPATFTPSAHTHAAADVTGLAEFVQDAVAAMLVAGSNISFSYDDAANQLTVSASGQLGGSVSWENVTGKPSSFTPAEHTHQPSEVSGLAEYLQDTVAAMLQPGSGVALSYNDVAGTLTISASGGGGSGFTGAGSGITGLTGVVDNRLGILFDSSSSTQYCPDTYFTIVKDLSTANNASTAEFAFHVFAVNPALNTNQKGAAFFTVIGSGTSDSVAALHQAYSAAHGANIWAGCFDVFMQTGTTGQMKGIEIGVYNFSAEQPDVDAHSSHKIGLWISAAFGGTNRSTAAIATAGGVVGGTVGFFEGINLDGIHSTFLRFRNPCQPGAVGIQYDNSSVGYWGDAMRLPSVSRLAKWDGISAWQDLLKWDGSNIKLGNGTNGIQLDIPGLGVRLVQVGGNDSGGTGYRTLRVPN